MTEYGEVLLTGDDGPVLTGDDEYLLTSGAVIAPLTLDWRATVISQYANSPVILALIEDFFDAVNPAANIDDFLTHIWYVDIADSHGLDVWGRIVDVSRVVSLPPQTDFGFVEGSMEPFGQGPFYGGIGLTNNTSLSDDVFRAMIMAKAYANIAGCAAPDLNRMLLILFGADERAYAVDVGNMQMVLTFERTLAAYELAILTQSRVLPRPAGVSLSILQIEPASRFGFSEAGAMPFGQGTFFGDPAHAI